MKYVKKTFLHVCHSKNLVIFLSFIKNYNFKQCMQWIQPKVIYTAQTKTNKQTKKRLIRTYNDDEFMSL